MTITDKIEELEARCALLGASLSQANRQIDILGDALRAVRAKVAWTGADREAVILIVDGAAKKAGVYL